MSKVRQILNSILKKQNEIYTPFNLLKPPYKHIHFATDINTILTPEAVKAAIAEDDFEYIEAAHKTLSPKFYGEKVKLAQFAEAIQIAVLALQELDAIKKALFYGKSSELLEIPVQGDATCASLVEGVFEGSENLLHGIIGKATECGELLEAVVTAYAPIDKVNAIEEVGDGFWYDAIILNYYGSSFTQAQRTNIAKLAKRFPDAFTEHAAIVRDLIAERALLEIECAGKAALTEMLQKNNALRISADTDGIEFAAVEMSDADKKAWNDLDIINRRSKELEAPEIQRQSVVYTPNNQNHPIGLMDGSELYSPEFNPESHPNLK